MKQKLILLVCFSAIILSTSLLIAHVFADELKGSTGGSLNALNSGYAITRWPWNSGDIMPGEDATVRACTTEPPHPEATQVVFRWNRPDGSHVDVGPKPLTLSGDTWDGLDVWDAYDTFTIDMVGAWGVQALFMDADGNLMGPQDPYAIVAIRAISYHSVPEVPLGTIAATLSMLGALGIFAFTRRKKAIPKFSKLP